MKFTLYLVFAALVFLSSEPCSAGLVTTTSDVSEVSPPSSVKLGDSESDTAILAFFESAQVLPSSIVVDLDGPCTTKHPTFQFRHQPLGLLWPLKAICFILTQ